jgi:hypothetical protein
VQEKKEADPVAADQQRQANAKVDQQLASKVAGALPEEDVEDDAPAPVALAETDGGAGTDDEDAAANAAAALVTGAATAAATTNAASAVVSGAATAAAGKVIEHNGQDLNIGVLSEDDAAVTKTKESLDDIAGTDTGGKLLDAFAKQGGTINVSPGEELEGAAAFASGNEVTLTGTSFKEGKDPAVMAELIGHELTHAVGKDEELLNEGVAYPLGDRIAAELKGSEWTGLDEQVASNRAPSDGGEGIASLESGLSQLKDMGIETGIDPSKSNILKDGDTSQGTVDAVLEELKTDKLQGVLEKVAGEDGMLNSQDASSLSQTIGESPGSVTQNYEVAGESTELTPAEAAALDFFTSGQLNGTTMFDSATNVDTSVSDLKSAIADGNWNVDDIANDTNAG